MRAISVRYKVKQLGVFSKDMISDNVNLIISLTILEGALEAILLCLNRQFWSRNYLILTTKCYYLLEQLRWIKISLFINIIECARAARAQMLLSSILPTSSKLSRKFPCHRPVALMRWVGQDDSKFEFTSFQCLF